MSIWAGFECARLWSGRQMIEETGHVPGVQIGAHYRVAMAAGCETFRDGLRPGLNTVETMRAVKRSGGSDVIWDMDHWWMPESPEAHALEVATAHSLVYGRAAPLKVCYCELSLYATMTGGAWTIEKGVDAAQRSIRALRDHLPVVEVYLAEPMGAPQFNLGVGVMDALRADADVFGVNIYPHSLRAMPSEILEFVEDRYDVSSSPVMETSWHDGYHSWPGTSNKAQWLDFITTQAGRSRDVCWYPFVNCPDWNDESKPDWNHGVLTKDGWIDTIIFNAIQALNRESKE